MSPVLSPSPHASSALARQQRAVLFMSWMAAALWWIWWRGDAVLLGALGVAVLLGGFALVLALQFVLMRVLNRHEPVPALGVGGTLRAWWTETCVAVRVFAWWQPFHWRRWPDQAVPVAPGQRALVLVHGFVCNRGLWMPWMQTCRQEGIPYTTVNLEPVFGSIDDYVPVLEDAVRRAEALTGQPPLLVCHSMGGLAARAWLAATPSAAGRVHAVVTIGTPHHGTWIARWSHTTKGRQMRIGGDWLRDLVAREKEQARPAFICWYSNADNIVFPATTAMLEGADNRLLQGVPHVALAYHPSVVDSTLALAQQATAAKPA